MNRLLKRVAPPLLALTLILPTVASGATTGAHIRWDQQPSGTYSYVVYVCDSNFGDTSEPRIINAEDEWNEIGGELRFSWTNWSSTECQAQWGANSNVIWLSFDVLGGNTLADTDCQLNFSGTEVEDCRIRVDTDGQTTDCGSYTWYIGTGSPGANQIDLESVLVHEFGHALLAGGHVTGVEAAIMDDTLSDNGGCSEGVEKDERLYTTDTENYTMLYGTTH